MLLAASVDILQHFSLLHFTLSFCKAEPTSLPLDAEFLDKNALQTRPRKRKVLWAAACCPKWLWSSDFFQEPWPNFSSILPLAVSIKTSCVLICCNASIPMICQKTFLRRPLASVTWCDLITEIYFGKQQQHPDLLHEMNMGRGMQFRVLWFYFAPTSPAEFHLVNEWFGQVTQLQLIINMFINRQEKK